jgi:uncharacterized protein (TIGR03032 family)
MYDGAMSDAEPELPTTPAPPPPLRSVHTTNFPQILAEAPASVLVTTYQAGKLVILRNDDGVLNTHFRNFAKPMGLAAAGGKLAVGASIDIWEFHNVPAVCPRLDASEAADDSPAPSIDAPAPAPSPSAGRVGDGGDAGTRAEPRTSGSTPPVPSAPTTALRSVATGDRARLLPPHQGVGNRKHDACFLPRRSHTTGDVQIHEMAWVGDELWFVNTAFSCLATRSDANSFEPRWRPRFVDKLLPGDCCHLNGLAIRDGRVRYVTALGETGDPGGWRENKRNGGVLIDVDDNEVIARGLSMPHSPRWYRNRLWLLESGDGSFGTVDLDAGRYEPMVKLPGFTRGLAFLGPLALIGLSQVRESAVFSGVPLVERLAERTCGVWVVHLDTGRVVAFVQFEDAVQEIFAVEMLAGIRYPDLINHDADLIGRSYVLPDAALADVPAELRSA